MRRSADAPTGGADDKRERILEAAIRCFGERGYHGTRTVDIAREAGVGEGTIYNHFRDKADLFRSVVECISRRIDAIRTVARPNVRPRERFLAMMEDVEHYFHAHPSHADILSRDLRHRDVSDIHLAFSQRHVSDVAHHLGELAVEAGCPVSESVLQTLALSLTGALDIILARWCALNHQGPMQPSPVEHVRAFLAIIEGGAKGGDRP